MPLPHKYQHTLAQAKRRAVETLILAGGSTFVHLLHTLGLPAAIWICWLWALFSFYAGIGLVYWLLLRYVDRKGYFSR